MTESLDLAIIGGGPAALSAALYAARAGLKVSVFERSNIGGALAEISHISNYPGFDGPGPELAAKMRESAVKAGATIDYGECTKLLPQADHFELTIDGEAVSARAVLVATGSEPRHLDVATSRPVSYCALCDGDLVRGKKVAVVGGANSAVQESLYLAGLAGSVTLISHSPFKASPDIMTRAKSVKNIIFQPETEATTALLDSFDHIFVFIGKKPATSFLEPLAKTVTKASLLDKNGYILCNNQNSAHETIIPGLFAAGDVRSGALRQAITAAADGATAATEIAEYLK